MFLQESSFMVTIEDAPLPPPPPHSHQVPPNHALQGGGDKRRKKNKGTWFGNVTQFQTTWWMETLSKPIEKSTLLEDIAPFDCLLDAN